MLPLTCPSASPVPGPFDLTAPHILPWLVYTFLLTIPICLLGGVGKLIHDLQRGVQRSAHRWLSWLKGGADLCFTVGYPPVALSVAWAAALDAWNEALGQQGCALAGEGLSLAVPHSQDAFATWLIVGASALVVFGVCYPLLDLLASRRMRRKSPQGVSRATSAPEQLVSAGMEAGHQETRAKGIAPGTRPTQPDAWDRWFYKGAVCAITLATGCGFIIHGEGLLQSTQPAFLLPPPNTHTEFVLPMTVISGTAPLETVGPHGNRRLTV